MKPTIETTLAHAETALAHSIRQLRGRYQFPASLSDRELHEVLTATNALANRVGRRATPERPRTPDEWRELLDLTHGDERREIRDGLLAAQCWLARHGTGSFAHVSAILEARCH